MHLRLRQRSGNGFGAASPNLVAMQIEAGQRPAELQQVRYDHGSASDNVFLVQIQLHERVITHLLHWDLAERYNLLVLRHGFGKSSAAVTKGVAAHVKRGQRPVDLQHFGDSLGTSSSDLGAAPACFQVEGCERGVGLESGTYRDCTFVPKVVFGQACAFQRPVEQSSNRIE